MKYTILCIYVPQVCTVTTMRGYNYAFYTVHYIIIFMYKCCYNINHTIFKSTFTLFLGGFIPQPKPGDVRLVGGTFPSRGQLEVFHNGSWVQPCTDEFGENATSAVCTQLGYNGTHSFSLISQQ